MLVHRSSSSPLRCAAQPRTAPRTLLAPATVALALLASAASAPPVAADDASKARSGLNRLHTGVARQAGPLGQTAAGDLGRLADNARAAQRQGQTCQSLRALGRFITTTKRLDARTKRGDAAAALGVQARRLQLTVLRAAAPGESCAITKPRARVDRRLKPARSLLPAMTGAGTRPLARLVGSSGDAADFAERELLVATADTAKLKALLKRRNGTLLATADPKSAGMSGPPVHLVRIDPRRGQPAGLAADLRRLDPRARGRLRVSSRDGLALLATAADEATRGMKVGVNYVGEGEQFLDRAATEAAPGQNTLAIGALGYEQNPFEWPYMERGGQKLGAAEGWRSLEIAGKLANRVRIAIIDGGFAPSADFSPASTGADGTPGVMTCGGTPCPFHGTSVAMTAGAVADNSFGVAGAAGPIADLTMIQHDGTQFSAIQSIQEAVDSGARIINMSFSTQADALVSFTLVPIELATMSASNEGLLLFAAAGNDGDDVDAEDCVIACWEEQWHAPCENQGVICVGGLEANSKWRDKDSNYGYEWCGKAPCDVDIFAPYTVFAGPDPANPGNRTVSGTSVASPYAAGVAALIWAAKPSLAASAVEELLMTWAHASPDKKVYHYVNAQSSIWRALGGIDIAPAVQIDAPANGAKVGTGGLNIVEFKAAAGDIEDGDACCTISWSSNVDGALGSGSNLSHTFTSPGKREVTATVTDSAGQTASDSVTIDAGADKPTATIKKPGPGATLHRNVSYVFQGSAYDPNEPGLSVDCDSLKWTSQSKPEGVVLPLAGPSGAGCQTVLKFSLTGDYTVTLKATDSSGETDTASIKVKVVDSPPSSKPAPQIINQADGSALDPWKSYLLSANTNELDGDIMSFEWTLKHGATTKVIGTSPQVWWKPGDDVSGNCSPEEVTVTFKATDKDGSGSDTAGYSVIFPAC